MLVRALRQCDAKVGPFEWDVIALFDGQVYELPEEAALALIEAGSARAVDSAPAGSPADQPPLPPQAPPSAGGDEFKALTVAELRERAAAAGLDVPSRATRAALVAALGGTAVSREDSSAEE